MHYELRAWAISSNHADDDIDGVVDVDAFPGDDAGFDEGMSAYRELVDDAGRMLSACMASGIDPSDFKGMGTGLFKVGFDESKPLRVEPEAVFHVPFGEDGRPCEPRISGRIASA